MKHLSTNEMIEEKRLELYRANKARLAEIEENIEREWAKAPCISDAIVNKQWEYLNKYSNTPTNNFILSTNSPEVRVAFDKLTNNETVG